MFEKAVNEGMAEVYVGTLPSGESVKVMYTDLDEVKIAELYRIDDNPAYGAADHDTPDFRFVNGKLETGCPDSDFATYRPIAIEEKRTVEDLVAGIGTLPEHVQNTIYDRDRDYLLDCLCPGILEG